jgi:hypothetical protein
MCDYPSGMDGAWLVRARWRRRGAWLWPTFVVAVLLDGVILHALPVVGDGSTIPGGVLTGLIFSLLAVLFCSRPLGSLLRRRRPDLPAEIARNYAGTFAVVCVTGALLALGVLHHASVVAQQRTLDTAVQRAELFIGSRAPASFRANATHPDTYVVQPGVVYRVCVPDRGGGRVYCVIVTPQRPFAESVRPDGYEPNSVFGQGLN